GEPSRVYDVLANPVEIEGETDGWVLVIRDITRDRELQDQLQRQDRLAAVGQLAAGIAHDFNNILAVIVLYVQMLQRSANLGAVEQKRLGVVREQAQHASALVRQVLDFSRMSVIERGPVDLVGLVRGTFDMWQRVLPENIRLTFAVEGPSGMCTLTDTHAESDVGVTDAGGAIGRFIVEGDATRLQQVLMNLAVNARDAMPDGGSLHIRLARHTANAEHPVELQDLPPDRWITLSVEDTGMGIAPEHLPHVFDPFFTTKAVGKGTGLGLAQVYGIVRQHGGHVTADSRLGAGTRFHLTLPLLLDASREPEQLGDDIVANEGTGRILLVEDNPAAREATRAILELYGYDVLEATNGTDALRVFRAQTDAINLVLTDVMMPEMGGIELFQTLAEAHPNLRVLFMTGYPLDDVGRQLMELGTVDWLQKPFSIQQLTEKIRNLLQ
ncbi:MAG: ATP-binding protein, partial [Litorilinea sp.]